MTDKKTEALKLALAVLKEWRKGFPDDWTDFDTEAAAAIREALADQCVCGEPDTPGTHRTDGPCLAEHPAIKQDLTPEQPAPVAKPRKQQEPLFKPLIDSFPGLADELKALDVAQPQEPVAYIHRQGNHLEVSERFLCDDEKARGWTEEPLYTSPPASKPLTDQEIVDICDGTLTTWEQVRIARAIEAAHGITGEE
jgi:hypothetical protein